MLLSAQGSLVTGPGVVNFTVQITEMSWSLGCTAALGVDLIFAVKTVSTMPALMEVVVSAVLPWSLPWSAEGAVPPNTGQMEVCAVSL